jgi:hypothetical protein
VWPTTINRQSLSGSTGAMETHPACIMYQHCSQRSFPQLYIPYGKSRFFFVSTVLNFASTVFFFVSTVLNFASTVFFFVSTVFFFISTVVESLLICVFFLAPRDQPAQRDQPATLQPAGYPAPSRLPHGQPASLLCSCSP